MPLLSTIGAAAARAFGFLKSLFAGYAVDNSLRFNSGSSDYLSRTPASASNRQKWTLSGWYKLAVTNTTDRTIFGAGTDGDNQTLINFQDTSVILFMYELSNVRYIVDTDAVYRDQSAWYHVVVAVDTTQATDTNRVKIYVNGVQQTLTVVLNGYPPQNANTFVNNTSAHAIGYASWTSSNFYNGYMSEVYLIDGQQLTPSSFGETDEDTGIWKPIPYTGTFGTNGFYLEFKDSSALGDDTSGNGNDFTVNNLTSIDQTTDTPTNNFCTMNPLSRVSVTLTEGNLKGAGAGDQNFRSTFAVNKGKWYWEVKLGADGGVWGICSENVTMATDRSSNAGVYGIQNAGGSFAYFRNNGSTGESAGFPNPVSGNIMNMAFDADNAKLYIGINGTYYNLSGSTGNPATGSNATYSSINTALLWLAFCEFRGAGQSCELNFGSPPFTISSGNADAEGFGNFEYAVPSGYFALCTKNLADYG